MTSDSVIANIRKILAKQPIYCLNQFIFMMSICYLFLRFPISLRVSCLTLGSGIVNFNLCVSLCVLNLLILSYTCPHINAVFSGGAVNFVLAICIYEPDVLGLLHMV